MQENQITESQAVDTAKLDPWEMHETLMRASDQTIPDAPVLHPGLILYAALNLEEGQETIEGLQKSLHRIFDSKKNEIDLQTLEAIGAIAAIFKNVGNQMAAASTDIRSLLKKVDPSFKQALIRDEIREMADGTTDLFVTNAGFALSLGIPGKDCYKEVAGSNLSKINPDTGKIDKTPDGKWIKGRLYREPNLDKVLGL